MNIVGSFHGNLIFKRRTKTLAAWFAEFVPQRARVLDVGCGDGLISSLLQAKRPDLTLQGIDVLPRAQSHIPVTLFDGRRIPFDAGAFEVVLFSDVLHHTDDPTILLEEAHRVARFVLIKDHYCNGFAAHTRLRFMDWVGNARFGVALPYNYWTKAQWSAAWRKIGMQPEKLVTQLGLYPPVLNWVFGADLHFIALLQSFDSQ